MARRNRESKRHEAPAVATQDTPEQIWRRWDAMHQSMRLGSSPLEAVTQCTWVYSAVTFICEHIMRTPFVEFIGDKPQEGGTTFDAIRRPNNYDQQNTDAKLRYAYFFELLLHGAVMRVFGDMTGFRPNSMFVRPRRAFRVDWNYDDNGVMVARRWSSLQASKTFIPDDTIYHDALYNPLHDFEGMSPLTSVLLSIANDISVNAFTERFFANDGSSGVAFSTDHPSFGQTQAEAAAKAWKEMHSGTANAFNAKFLGMGLKPFQLGTALDGKLFQILRTFTKEEVISGIYKIPLDAISSSESGGDIVIGGPSGGTQASSREAFLVNVVQPWALRYDEEFSRDVAWRFGGVQMKHDFTGNPILERRRLERASAAVQLIDRGVPLNEVIRWLQLGIVPQPHGDDWWVENDKLPARVVLDAGDDALKIAIPDPVPPQVTRQQRQVLTEYVASVLQTADSVQFKNGVRSDPLNRVNGRVSPNRIRDLLAGITVSPLEQAGGGDGN